MTTSPVSYQAGSLNYTRHGLLTLSCWLLWGDFAFYFFEAIFLRFIRFTSRTTGLQHA